MVLFKNSEYDQEIPQSQSQTTDNLWHRDEEPHNNY